ncbi:Protein Wnt-4 [Aphelenchoides besseyi]|nr:Protein Wnt-4 [Aphelenchoides besseyi]KAI6200779.1 Protein Wnt-4 [Aphelenchoides besseyi]
MEISRSFYTTLLLFFESLGFVSSWWPLAQLASTSLPTNSHFDCRILAGLTRKQQEICKQNRFAVRSAADGIRDAVEECRIQFAVEKWNCTTKHGNGIPNIPVASRESAFVHALTAGAVSRAVAKACSLGQIPDCQCGDRPQQSSKNFIWAGCADNVRYGNFFSRRFIDTAEKQRLDGRALMNLHNNRVGRKVLASNLRKQCKCHGVSGSCVTKTCWKTVPLLEDYASVLKQKYSKAQQVTVMPERSELVLKSGSARAERSAVEASKAELVYLEKSPDFCDIHPKRGLAGTSGRECFGEEQCHDLCCGRGWIVEHHWQNEACRCKFEWCCEVKCQTCTKLVQRRFCR